MSSRANVNPDAVRQQAQIFEVIGHLIILKRTPVLSSDYTSYRELRTVFPDATIPNAGGCL